MYSMIIDAEDVAARYSVLESQNGSLADFLENYYRHVDAGAFDLLCSSLSRGMTKEQLADFNLNGNHDVNCTDDACPWRLDVIYYTDAELLVGDDVILYCEQADANSKWYCNGEETGDTGATITKKATAQALTYQCKNGDTVLGTYVVLAQTSVLSYYISRVSNYYYDWNTGYKKDDIYTLMTGEWNVVANAYQKAEPVNLAQSILAYWYETGRISMIDDMFCSCCFTTDGKGNYTFDGIMRRPNDLHEETCDWWQKPVEGLTPLLRADGTIEGYVLAIADTNGNVKVVATTDMLDGMYHYFKDVESGLYVAFLDVDATGNAWIVPLKSERESAEETPAN